MLPHLDIRVEEYIGQSGQSAALTVFDFKTLYQEDLNNGFEYMGLRYVSFPVRYGMLSKQDPLTQVMDTVCVLDN